MATGLNRAYIRPVADALYNRDILRLAASIPHLGRLEEAQASATGRSPVCGSTVFHTEEGVEGSVGVAVGGFGDPDFPPPQDSVYTCRMHGWVRLPQDVRAYDRDPM